LKNDYFELMTLKRVGENVFLIMNQEKMTSSDN
jgi:hypothetical protein